MAPRVFRSEFKLINPAHQALIPEHGLWGILHQNHTASTPAVLIVKILIKKVLRTGIYNKHPRGFKNVLVI